MAVQTIAQLFDLTGKGAIVTGGAVGIGRAVAFRLAEAGAGVMVADIDLGGASQTVKQIEVKGGKARAMTADVRSTADAKKVAWATVEAFGCLDILVNNAGVYPQSPALDISEQAWDKVLDTNLKGTFFYCQAAAQEMIKAGHGGKIVNLASMDALHPSGALAHYGASKAGVVMLTKALALELAPHMILVNVVAPGTVKTPGTDALSAATSMATGMSPDEIIKKYLQARVPLRRQADPDDIAKVVLFLVSAAADYMSGSLVLVDGGYLLS
jgi:2-deoxy-D-gluconate 3-dehydrogenase